MFFFLHINKSIYLSILSNTVFNFSSHQISFLWQINNSYFQLYKILPLKKFAGIGTSSCVVMRKLSEVMFISARENKRECLVSQRAPSMFIYFPALSPQLPGVKEECVWTSQEEPSGTCSDLWMFCRKATGFLLTLRLIVTQQKNRPAPAEDCTYEDEIPKMTKQQIFFLSWSGRVTEKRK